ncbi:hypothetical protein [Streptomyces sp. RKAG290]|uniref:hypothetical protein n=1 Tax=Streptomyces sp. RKAG290 TaxID=2888348 RepID=UPI0020342A06|nr:hypothetical protein [Streptomyces sp. RKAG290]MCM2411033.1 hypothetical protein [Streptomyces sp. RKAG290]
MVPVRSARLSAALVCALVVGLTTGCAESAHEVPVRVAESPRASGASADGDVTHRRLPVEDYLLSPTENDRVERARSALIGTCMKRFGFDFTPNTPDYKKMSGQVSNRYGPTDTKTAAAHGYHPDQPRMGAREADAQKALSKDMKRVLGGSVDSSGKASPRTKESYRGIRIPKDGCSGDSDRRLTAGGGLIQDDAAAIAVNFESFEKSAADPRVKKVFAEWSTCMKEKKFSYATPLEAINDQRWRTDEPSVPEIATAVAEVECKQRYDVVGVWFSVESSYQRADIKAKAKRMARVRKGIDVAFRNAAAVVGE